MNRLGVVTILSLFVVATVAGGAAVRLAVAAGEARFAVTLAFLAGALLVAAVGGARDRRWRRNPYW